MKTTTAIKITTVTLVLILVGIVLDFLTIKNYMINWSTIGTALCANVCILCCEIEKKKKEDAEAKKTASEIG